MGHNQLQKCSKYHLVSFLLTYSAMYWLQWNGNYTKMRPFPIDICGITPKNYLLFPAFFRAKLHNEWTVCEGTRDHWAPLDFRWPGVLQPNNRPLWPASKRHPRVVRNREIFQESWWLAGMGKRTPRLLNRRYLHASCATVTSSRSRPWDLISLAPGTSEESCRRLRSDKWFQV